MQKIINKQKAPKDTILNNIMHEIGEENAVVNNIVKREIKKEVYVKKKKKRSWLSIFFNLMLIVITLVILFIFYIITIASKDEGRKSTSKIPVHKEIFVSSAVPKVIEKSTQHIELFKKPIVEKKPTENKSTITEEKEKVLERKRAKAALMEQMNN